MSPVKNADAKKHQKNRAEKQSILDKVDLALEGEVQLQELRMQALVWTAKVLVGQELPESHRHYRTTLFFNEQPYIDQIAAIQRDLEAGLFKGEPVAEKNAKKQIQRIEDDMQKKRDLCETIEFTSTVLELKYGTAGTSLKVQIADTTVEHLNAKKALINKHYRIRLEPVSI